MARGRALLVMAIASAVGCGGESLGGHAPMGTGGSGGVDLIDGTPVCGEMQEFSVSAPAPPDILILMDRSSSLLDDATGTSCTGGCGASSKWALLTAAVDKLVVGIGSVNWGLMFFGTDDACGVNPTPVIPVSDNAAGPMSIVSVLGAQAPGGDAPTNAALSAAAEYLGSLSDVSPKYVLLVTDGKSGCSSEPGAYFSFPTFVLAAVAPSDTTAIAALNEMAVNGGEPQQGGANAFYTTADDLGAELDPTRVSLATSCAIALGSPVPPGMTLAIEVPFSDGSGMLISEDATNGWEFTDASHTSITLNGTSCESSKDGGDRQIVVTYLCDGPQVLGHGRAQGR